MSSRFEGGCLCGAIRYVADGDPVVVALCHCPSCRRSAGAPVVAWAIFARDKFAVTRGLPAVHASSAGVERAFCGACGTPLTWSGEILPGFIDVTVGSFDDPTAVTPQMHIWNRHRIPWLEISDALTRHEELPPAG